MIVKIDKQIVLEANVFDLQKEMNKIKKKNEQQFKILNDKKLLEKRLDKLKLIDAPSPKQIKIKNQLKSQSSGTEYSDSDGTLIDKDLLYSKYNLKKFKRIDYGYTTFIFDDPINKKHVIGFTVDEQKIKWLQANKEDFEFILLDTDTLTKGNKVYIYSMIKVESNFKKIPEYYQKIITNDIATKFFDLRDKKSFGKVTVKDLDYFMYNIHDPEILKILKKLKNTFPDSASLDLHRGQWGYVNNKVILFDPIISNKALNQIDELNSIDIKTQFSLFASKLFNDSNSDYIKKIMSKLKV